MYFESPVKHSQIVMRLFKAKSLQFTYLQTKKQGNQQYFVKCKHGTLLLYLGHVNRHMKQRKMQRREISIVQARLFFKVSRPFANAHR